MSRENYQYNPISAKNLQKAKPVIYEGVPFPSCNSLAKHLGVKSARISYALRTGRHVYGAGGYVDEQI